VTEDQIKHMVDRFLGWRLPEDFHPDAGISFKKTFNDHMPHPMKHEPVGTNLFDAIQATAMVRYMLEGIQPPSEEEVPTKWLVDALRSLARELVADPKTPWIGERKPELHICWTAADRIDARTGAGHENRI
jgi:hypothetical protein